MEHNLTLQGVTKKLSSFQLGPLDLTMNPGHIIAVIGTNGAGKSTLFQLIMQVLQPDDGKITFFGENTLEEIETKQRVAYLGEYLEVLKHLSIVNMARFIARWYPRWDQQLYQTLLVRYQLDERKKYHACSAGTKKKVAFILALSCSPDLLLLDEPSTGVDLPSQKKMIDDLIEFMEDEQKSVLLASHNLEEMNRLADEIYVLDQGQLIRSFTKEEVQESWGIIWLDQPLPHDLSSHAHIIATQNQGKQIVTDHLQEMEQVLKKQKIGYTHIQRLNLIEVMEYLIDTENTTHTN